MKNEEGRKRELGVVPLAFLTSPKLTIQEAVWQSAGLGGQEPQRGNNENVDSEDFWSAIKNRYHWSYESFI